MEAKKITSKELFDTLMGVESMAINTIIALFTENNLTEMKMSRYTVSFDANEGIKTKSNDGHEFDFFRLETKTIVTILHDCEEFVANM